jgi:2-desacetyl-2-hydroxyethyl bacteriochlorophyllide A dehydrogenase
MKAIVLRRGGAVEMIEKPTPEVPPGWVRLATAAIGICGSDLHLQSGAFPAPPDLQPGHEAAGIIDAVGDGVDLPTGGLMAIEPIDSCGACPSCYRGFYNTCAELDVLGVTTTGGMADFALAPAERLYPLDAATPFHRAALTEPMAVCVRAARLAQIQLGDTVAILGAGSIGILSVAAARAAGASEVHVTARHPHQAERALSLGATAIHKDGAALLAAVGPNGVDAVVETVGGKANTLSEAVMVARPGGRVVVLGLFDGEPAFPAIPLVTKEISLVGSNCYAFDGQEADFKVATRLVEKLGGGLDPMVTHRFAFDQVAEAYGTAADKSTGSIKVQLFPHGVG